MESLVLNIAFSVTKLSECLKHLANVSEYPKRAAGPRHKISHIFEIPI